MDRPGAVPTQGRGSEIPEGKEVAIPEGVEPQIPQVYYDDSTGLQTYHVDPQPDAAPKVEAAKTGTPSKSRKKKYILICIAVIVLALAVFLPVGLVVSRNREYRQPKPNA
ncbi:MAG: hypothetical protein LQ337_002804 [Flavoplaca oasis]|nr:MAG: hypothetical protein LQ337_002804 [Flavoplaca oasis]